MANTKRTPPGSKKISKEKPFAETLPDLGEYAALNISTLQPTLDNYFYLWMLKEIPIDEEIESFKAVNETKRVSKLIAEKGWDNMQECQTPALTTAALAVML